LFIELLILGPLNDLGASKECKDAPFVPGYNLAGEGFDVVTMERKGAYVINTEIWDLGKGTCKLRKNEYMNGIQQKLPAAVEHWRTLPKCSMKVSSQIFESSEALVNDSSSALSKVGIDVKAVGAAVGSTHSREAKFAMTKSKHDKYSFTKHEVGSCPAVSEITHSMTIFKLRKHQSIGTQHFKMLLPFCLKYIYIRQSVSKLRMTTPWPQVTSSSLEKSSNVRSASLYIEVTNWTVFEVSSQPAATFSELC
uniref:Uncharacterized protein n=1 Tax=Cyprinus carpio TaxID=7962 RepID=A0A8C1XWM3_CYPCA